MLKVATGHGIVAFAGKIRPREVRPEATGEAAMVFMADEGALLMTSGTNAI